MANIETLRASWEKTLNPILRVLSYPDRGYLRIRKDIILPRPFPPSPSSFSTLPKAAAAGASKLSSKGTYSKGTSPAASLGTSPVDGSYFFDHMQQKNHHQHHSIELPSISARLYFKGTNAELRTAAALILHIPGGGFVAMPPRCHDDYTSLWANQTGLPVVSIGYGKAPEFPYPWALEECFDAYRSIVESNGEVVGMEGWYRDGALQGSKVKKAPIRIIVSGDSAGGNLAAGLILKCLESSTLDPTISVPTPSGLILIYPALQFDMACWLPNRDRALLRAESKASMAMQNIVDSHERLKPSAPFSMVPAAPRSIDVQRNTAEYKESWYRRWWESMWSKGIQVGDERVIRSSLSMTSRMCYFTDRILAPEFMRAMALMYLGSSPLPIDFSTDHYLSPIVASDELLSQFPRTFFVCGEKDPLIDDTVFFASRLREARKRCGGKKRESDERLQDTHEEEDKVKVEDCDETYQSRPPRENRMEYVRVKIIEGLSHAFFQMFALLPEAKPIAQLVGDWAAEMVIDSYYSDSIDPDMGTVVEDEEDGGNGGVGVGDGVGMNNNRIRWKPGMIDHPTAHRSRAQTRSVSPRGSNRYGNRSNNSSNDNSNNNSSSSSPRMIAASPKRRSVAVPSSSLTEENYLEVRRRTFASHHGI